MEKFAELFMIYNDIDNNLQANIYGETAHQLHTINAANMTM